LLEDLFMDAFKLEQRIKNMMKKWIKNIIKRF
jgi:hypothetical protein